MIAARSKGAFHRRFCLHLEQLESRVVPASTPLGYTPTQMAAAYDIPTSIWTGAGQTVAVITAYNAPTIVADFNAFSTKFGLPTATSENFQVVSFANRPDRGWAQEAALDVQWVHAIAPAAKIVFVQAKSNSLTDMMNAVKASVINYKATVVSMSWGASESSSQLKHDPFFMEQASNGVTFVAASGDNGKVIWPSSSPYVISVGGTSLKLAADNTVVSETGWSNQYGSSGGGVSAYESKPSYQNSQNTGSKRTTPDVALDADPLTGVPVYYNGSWLTFGGTSAAAPQWAGLIALANQARGKTLSGYTEVLPWLYSKAGDGTYFRDIVSGGKAAVGYDLATGLGVPRAANVIADLAAPQPALLATTSTPTITGGSAPTRQTNRAAIPINDLVLFLSAVPRDPLANVSVVSQVVPLARPSINPLPPVPTQVPGVTGLLQFSPIYLSGGPAGFALGQQDARPAQAAPIPVAPPIQPDAAPPQEQAPETMSYLWLENDSTTSHESTESFGEQWLTMPAADVTVPHADNLAVGVLAAMVLGFNWNAVAAHKDPRTATQLPRRPLVQ